MLGKCNLRLGEYENALLAMEQLDEQKIALNYKGSYYLQQAIAKRMLGDIDGFEQECQKFNAVTNESSPDVERRRRILAGETDEECLSLIDIGEPLKKGCKTANFMFGFSWYLLAAVLFTQLCNLMPAGYEYRSWLSNVGFVVLYVGGLIYVTAALIKIYRWFNARFFHEGAHVLNNIIWAVLFIIEGILFLYWLFAGIIGGTQEISSGDALRVRKNSFWETDSVYVCEPKGIFFRKFIYNENTEYGYDFDDSGNIGEDYDNDYFSPNDDYYSPEDDYYSNGGELDADDWEALLKEQFIKSAYQSIYEVEFAGTSGELEFIDSASGDCYAVMGKYELDEEVENLPTAEIAQKSLRYDRDSKNDEYYLIVCYIDYYDAAGSNVGDTRIVDFYAVNKISYEVIRADKHAWEDLGSEEYREATGE